MSYASNAMSEHIFELADLLQLKLTVDSEGVVDCIEGQEDYNVVYGNGLTLKFGVEIEDSAVYKNRQMVCAIAHFIGNLYGLFFVDGRKGEFTMMILDGSKLDWKSGSIKVFPAVWDEMSSRADVYAKVYKGVVGGGLRKKGYQNNWIGVTRKEMLEVLAEKLVTAGLMTNDGVIIEKPKAQPKAWNTIGPRGV